MNVRDAFYEILRTHGITTVFGNPAALQGQPVLWKHPLFSHLVTGGEASRLESRGHADDTFGKEPASDIPLGGWRTWPPQAQLPFGGPHRAGGPMGSDQPSQATSIKVRLARTTEARSGPSAIAAEQPGTPVSV